MKLLLFSDVHGNTTACHRLVELAQTEAVDLVIGAGDFGNFRRGLAKPLAILAAINRPTVLVPGNAESDAELASACQSVWPGAVTLHGTGATLQGLKFWGLGGGIPITPFGPWSFDFTEAQAAEMLAGCPGGAILVSHSPPKGAVDVSSRGQSLGSSTLRRTILEKQPRLVVCGHIHESAGQSAKIDQTPVVNAGPHGMIWKL